MNKMRWMLAAMLGLALVAAGVGVGIANSPSANPGAQTQGAATNQDDDAGENETGETEEAEGADSDAALTGTDAEKASAAALAYTDAQYATGGRVTEVESGDDGAAFGAEVMLPDGRQVEVHLDAAFTVTGDEGDDD